MSCNLEGYRARLGTWAGRFSGRGVPRRGGLNGTTGDCLSLTVPRSMLLAVSLIIGTVVEVENTVRLLCTGCGRNLKSGFQ